MSLTYDIINFCNKESRLIRPRCNILVNDLVCFSAFHVLLLFQSFLSLSPLHWYTWVTLPSSSVSIDLGVPCSKHSFFGACFKTGVLSSNGMFVLGVKNGFYIILKIYFQRNLISLYLNCLRLVTNLNSYKAKKITKIKKRNYPRYVSSAWSMKTFNFLLSDPNTQLIIQLKSVAMENKIITKMPYKEKNSRVVMFCFMSRSVLDTLLFWKSFIKLSTDFKTFFVFK